NCRYHCRQDERQSLMLGQLRLSIPEKKGFLLHLRPEWKKCVMTGLRPAVASLLSAWIPFRLTDAEGQVRPDLIAAEMQLYHAGAVVRRPSSVLLSATVVISIPVSDDTGLAIEDRPP
ncbi:hypothetical protein FOZ62_022494, partial [Perkinsus olseni]